MSCCHCCRVPQLNTAWVTWYYATVHWQMHFTGQEDCMYDHFLLPRHVGTSHTLSVEESPKFQFWWKLTNMLPKNKTKQNTTNNNKNTSQRMTATVYIYDSNGLSDSIMVWMLTQLGHLTNDKRKNKRGQGEDESGSLAINIIVTLARLCRGAMRVPPKLLG